MGLLDKIANPNDLKGLTTAELELLAKEVREFIINNVSETGGHLASSLGAVDLILALHYVFNTPQDRIVWDVGHQSYAHKIITGRKDKFSELRQTGGLSPFINPSESGYDSFISGHAGNAISAASGISEAFKKQGIKNRVIAVIGDGSLSNGLTFEGLNFVGMQQLNMLVILNDNEMFISTRVGALADYLSRLMTSRKVRSVKERIKTTMFGMPFIGKRIYKMGKHIEGNLKGVVSSGGTLFEQIGFRYIGPIDGHNMAHLVEAFDNISNIDGPIFMHIITKKGYGYGPAYLNPENFHGIGKFHKLNGESKAKAQLASYSDVFGDTLVELAKEDDRIVAITAAMKKGTGLDAFASEFPERFFDVGIAEGHAVTMAAGMAMYGLRPVVAIYSTFFQRAYDEIIHDVALQNLPVIFAIDRAGIVGQDGPTHNGAYDMAFMRDIPNIVLLVPRDQIMLREMLTYAFRMNEPVAIRYPRDTSISDPIEFKGFALGKAEIIKDGKEVAIFCTGPLIYEAIKAAVSFDASIVDLRCIKPLDEDLVRDTVRKCGGKFVVIEDGTITGGAGSAVLECLSGIGFPLKYRLIGIPDRFIEHGKIPELRVSLGMDAAGIRSAIADVIRDEGKA
jgi:1-deoxy-D-xylulose-5-phosphate synthase